MAELLDNRLSAIAWAVRPGTVVADIGTDHGYLVCDLVEKGKCLLGYACDINPRPLDRARNTIARLGLEDRVFPILTDGLQNLPWQEIDVFVLAGMGGDLISEILEAAEWIRSSQGMDKQFIFQPMTKAEKLRRYLSSSGFEIGSETAVVAGRFPYTVICASFTGYISKPSELYMWTGLLLEQQTPEAKAYLCRVRDSLQKKSRGLGRSASDSKEEGSPEGFADLANDIEKKLEAFLC